MPGENPRVGLDPDQVPLTKLHAERLAGLSGVPARELIGEKVVDIGVKQRFRIDPRLLLYRRVCGRVVKKDPVSGKEYPVPFATVHVEDTDCFLLGFFPVESRWAWYFPIGCRREEIATVKTDACGEFCVWIPSWDIDWVLRFRRERRCYGTIFERPTLRDLLAEIEPLRRIPAPGPQPDPDPDPLASANPLLLGRVGNLLGAGAAKKLARLAGPRSFGDRRVSQEAALESADLRIAPPLPKEIRDGASLDASIAAFRGTLGSRLRISKQDLDRFDPRIHIGPFKRCHDVYIPEWAPIRDVPDITFRVTQDTNGDGIEETILSEGYFQVRWNSESLDGLVLEAQPNAVAGLDCGGGDPIPCGNVPAIVLAGRMPVGEPGPVTDASIYDAATGYALRPNRPHPSAKGADALPNPRAAAPFHDALTLLGCNRTDRRATHYRILYRYSSNDGATFGPPTPFLGLSWPLFRLSATGVLESLHPAADATGWYPILPSGPNPFLPQDILLDWPTENFPNGRYLLRVELGTGGVVSSSSAEVAFTIDNKAPSSIFTVEWRRAGESDAAYRPIGTICPVVARGAVKSELFFRVKLEATAGHLRSAYITAADCGGDPFVFESGEGTPAAPDGIQPGFGFGHWHTSVNDNSVNLKAIYRLPVSALQGTYSFHATVASRAFNPSDPDGYLLADPWEYNPAPVYNPHHVYFSVVDQD